MTHTVTDHTTVTGNALVDGVRSPYRVFAERQDNIIHFKLKDRDTFLKELFVVTGHDLRMRTNEEGRGWYPSHSTVSGVRVDTYYIKNLVETKAVFEDRKTSTDGPVLVTPAVLGGPHLNLLLTAVVFSAVDDCAKCLAAINKAFVDDGTATTRTVGK